MLKRIFITFMFAIISPPLFAWDAVKSGKILDMHVTGGGNYDLRVVLQGRPKLCGNNNDWAYINESDANYQSYLSVLLSAKVADRTVELYATRESSSGKGYCKIGYMILK
ncbi:hypothetical protein K6Q96_06985 [Grimontia kaedaensis]|uniref:Secreted protein n=1 Tax=Grimontia kaedaensis TaxID=2872157 RepID=A0ABY4WXL8_9GAMM|nr:hypothetical protein [Grimontia kaedaensis]USH03731.1 hypothetical protein K6Q96_06985 [Grimontia kaedaensis]